MATPISNFILFLFLFLFLFLKAAIKLSFDLSEKKRA